MDSKKQHNNNKTMAHPATVPWPTHTTTTTTTTTTTGTMAQIELLSTARGPLSETNKRA
jgi:hypothetical protein